MKCIIRTALVGLLLSLLFTGCSSGVEEPGNRVNGSDVEEIEITTNHEQTEENKNKAPGLSQYHEEPFYEKEAELVRLQDGSMKRSSVRLYGQEGQQGFTLVIDDLAITVRSDSLSGDIEIIDLKEDTKVVAIGAIGPAGPQSTYFYYYDFYRGHIVFAGKIPGGQEDIVYHGDGTLTTRKRGDILHTWFYEATYELNRHNILEYVPQDLYEMNSQVTVLKELPLQKSRENDEVALTLKPGEEATIVASDNREWCLVKNSEGVEGWFAVDDYSTIRGTDMRARQIFEGLNFAG